MIIVRSGLASHGFSGYANISVNETDHGALMFNRDGGNFDMPKLPRAAAVWNLMRQEERLALLLRVPYHEDPRIRVSNALEYLSESLLEGALH
jgi:hypothetical protein